MLKNNQKIKTAGSGEVSFPIMAPFLYGSFKAGREYIVTAVSDQVSLQEVAANGAAFEHIAVEAGVLSDLIQKGELVIV